MQLARDAAVPRHDRRDEGQDQRRELAKDEKDHSENGDASCVVARAHEVLKLGAGDGVVGDERGDAAGAELVDAVLEGAGVDEVVVDIFEAGFVEGELAGRILLVGLKGGSEEGRKKYVGFAGLEEVGEG